MRTNIFLMFIFLLYAIKCDAQATITGTLFHAPAQKIYLVNVYGKKLDSAITTAKNQTFTLKIKDINDEMYLKIFYQKKGPGTLNQFIIMPAENVVFNYDVNDLEKNWWIDVSGSPRTNERIGVFKRILPLKRNAEMIRKQIDSIKNSSTGSTGELAEKQQRADANESQANKIIKQVFDTTKSPLNALQMLSLLQSSNLYTENEKEGFKQNLLIRFPNDKNIQSLANNSNNDIEQGLAINTKAAEIVLADTAGRIVDLLKIKNKYVLIDFWASWCKPCRAESPNLVKTYSQFKGKGFEILAVSIDTNDKLWRDAIKADSTTDFTQVIDKNGPKSSLLRDYKLNSIPANFLIDENGVIVAKDLRGDELYQKVKKLLGTN